MPEAKAKPASTLRERALALLARREHSRFELSRKLGVAGFAQEEIDVLLDEFEAKNWLSDQRFAESYVADHCDKSGSIKLAHELRQRGVSDQVIELVICKSRENEHERAYAVWAKKFGSIPADPTEKARQIRFLQGRGFPQEIILGLLRGQINLT